MNSSSMVVLQTALRPMSITYELEGEFTIQLCEDFAGVFAIMQKLPLTTNTKLFVNRGPGSYAGIRTGIAYVMGLIHGGLIKKENVYSYTSFNLVASNTENTYIKSWPRTKDGNISNSTGYYFENGQIIHIPFKTINSDQKLTVFAEEIITEKLDNPLITLVGKNILENNTNFVNITQMPNLQSTLEPLYINPVNITKK